MSVPPSATAARTTVAPPSRPSSPPPAAPKPARGAGGSAAGPPSASGLAELERQLRTLRIANSVLLGLAAAALVVAVIAVVRTGTTADDVKSVSGALDASEQVVDDLQGDLATMGSGIDARATDLEASVDALRTQIGDVESASAADVREMQDRLDHLAMDLATLDALVDQLAEVLPSSR